ncbi:fungal-specific transcription factor domain-containing protein [Xylariales sp. PMI_506]|nr:fungal-specific transcription factor domain-containing protein [Xylariales sp. PMI_506]
MDHQSPPKPHYVRVRVANACDSCKVRKVKCDGKLPCSYCSRHKRAHLCHFSPQRRRRATAPKSPQNHNHHHAVTSDGTASVPPNRIPGSQSEASYEEEAEVPRDARLLYDAQGKLIFIGDCAPLSFFQTVRQLVYARVDPHAFASHTTRSSVLQNVHSSHPVSTGTDSPYIDLSNIHSIVAKYSTVTAGLVDVFSTPHLADDILAWAEHRTNDLSAAVNYLVLAIGLQTDDEDLAVTYFEHAKVLALATLGNELGVGTVQAFTLITLYMLRACQITGAFLFFGIAVRATYSVGAHRTEVNSRFGPDIQRHRDRLWTSVRIVDLFLSISMGRPPATSDVDCTVPYRVTDSEGREVFDLLSASVQILLITEGIVLEVYSRKKISLQLTEGISRQLRDWSTRWLVELKRIIATPAPSAHDGSETSGSDGDERTMIMGACQVLCSYYYAVMLVSRPFLMYETYKRLPEVPSKAAASGNDSTSSGRSKFANACIDAGSLMIETVTDLIELNMLDGRMPLIVSWIFSASLAVGLGLLGDFGRILEKDVRLSVTALEFFAKNDAHALQYSRLIRSLHSTALEYLDRKERFERLQISESSANIFGLAPRQTHELARASHDNNNHNNGNFQTPSSQPPAETIEVADNGREVSSSFFDDLDPSIFSFTHSTSHTPELTVMNGAPGGSHNTDQVFGALNLFPLMEEGGHIDLAHYL